MQGEDEPKCKEKSWLEPEREATEQERRHMWAVAVVAGVLGAMSNHSYRFQQHTRLQEDGGSIGKVLVGEMANVVMSWWKGEYLTLAWTATAHLQDTFILDCALYIDNDGLAFKFLPPGARWDGETGRMEVKLELVEEDLKVKEDV